MMIAGRSFGARPEPSRDLARFEWEEVTNVARYQLRVDTMTHPIDVRDEHAEYGGEA